MTPPEHGLCVIISGTPSAGFTVIGPFKHPAIANEWASTWEEDIDWWVAPLVAQSSREVPADQFTHAERQQLEAQNAAPLVINRIGHHPKE